ATKAQDVTWDADAHARLVAGQPAPLRSQTKVTAEQVLAIGLPDLTVETLPGADLAPPPPGDGSPDGPGPAAEAGQPRADAEEGLPACMNLNIVTVIDHLLLPDKDRHLAQKRLAQVTANMKALGIIDEHGNQ